MKLTDQEIDAIVRLRAIDDFKTFMNVIGRDAEKLTHNLIYCEPNKLEGAQGMVRAVVDIIDTVVKAERRQ